MLNNAKRNKSHTEEHTPNPSQEGSFCSTPLLRGVGGVFFPVWCASFSLWLNNTSELRKENATTGEPVFSGVSVPEPVEGEPVATITPENVSQIEQLACLDQGVPGEAAYSPDGKILASASDDGTVRLWGVRP